MSFANTRQLAKVTVVVKKTLGANGSLFGSVSKEEIAAELEKTHHLVVEKKAIDLDTHLKAVGLYDVSIKLGHSINATLKVDVQGE